MFLFFIILMLSSMVAFSTHLYTALMLQSQTITYAVQAYQQEQVLYGKLTYALAELAHNRVLRDELDEHKQVVVDGTVYHKTVKGYAITVRVDGASGLRAVFKSERRGPKMQLLCVAIDAF